MLRWSFSGRRGWSILLTILDAPHPHIAEFVAHWQGLAPEPGLLPGRRHFDPLAVPHLLPNIWLLDVEHGAPSGPARRYRVRLVGGAVVAVGFPARPGEYFDDPRITPDVVTIRRHLDTVVDTHRPDWRRGRPAIDHTKYVDTLERVIVPLAADGRRVDMLMGLTMFYWKDGERRA
jgi:hypothetical protein